MLAIPGDNDTAGFTSRKSAKYSLSRKKINTYMYLRKIGIEFEANAIEIRFKCRESLPAVGGGLLTPSERSPRRRERAVPTERRRLGFVNRRRLVPRLRLERKDAASVWRRLDQF